MADDTSPTRGGADGTPAGRPGHAAEGAATSRRARLVAWWRATFHRRRVPGRRSREIPPGVQVDDPRLVGGEDTAEWGTSSSSFDK